MDHEAIKKSILDSFRDREVVKAFTEHILDDILTPALKFRDDEIQALRNELKAKDDEISELRQMFDDQEKPSEEPNKLVSDMAAAAGVQVSATDIDVVHRLRGRAKPGAANTKPRDLIVKFTNMTKRKELWAARREFAKSSTNQRPSTRAASTSATSSSPPGIFITESLTKYRAEIMYKARQLKRENKLAAAWTDEGVMKVRRRDGEKTVVVRSLREVYDVIGQ